MSAIKSLIDNDKYKQIIFLVSGIITSIICAVILFIGIGDISSIPQYLEPAAKDAELKKELIWRLIFICVFGFSSISFFLMFKRYKNKKGKKAEIPQAEEIHSKSLFDITGNHYNIEFPKRIFDKKGLIVLAVLFGLIALFYHNSVFNKFVFDDVYYIEQNLYVHGVSSKNNKEIWSSNFTEGANRNTGLYRPLTNFMWMLTYEISPQLDVGGDPSLPSDVRESPALFHALNLIVHFINCFLVYILALIIFNNFAVGLISSILFALASIHTEPVNNVAVLSELLATTFIALTLIFHVKYRENKHKEYLLFALVSYVLAMLSKENGVGAIAFIMLLDFFFPKEREYKFNIKADFFRMLKNIWVYLSYGAIFFFYLFIRLSSLDKSIIDFFKNPVEAFTSEGFVAFVDNPMFDPTVDYFEQLITAVKVFGMYLLGLVFPLTLSCDFSYNDIYVISDFWRLDVIIPTLLIVILAFLIIFGFFKERRLSFLFIFFIVTFSIVSNFVVIIGTILGERLMYLPSIAFYIAFAAILVYPLKYIKKHREKIEFYVYAVTAVLAIFYGYMTYERNKDWKTNVTIFEADTYNVPNSTKVHQNLASLKANEAGYYKNQMMQSKEAELQKQNKELSDKRYNEAIFYSSRSVEVFPTNKKALLALGVSIAEMGDPIKGRYYVGQILDDIDLNTEEGQKMFFTKDVVNGYVQLSSFYLRERNFEKAKEIIEPYFKFDKIPDYDPLYAHYSICLINMFPSVEKVEQYILTTINVPDRFHKPFYDFLKQLPNKNNEVLYLNYFANSIQLMDKALSLIDGGDILSKQVASLKNDLKTPNQKFVHFNITQMIQFLNNLMNMKIGKDINLLCDKTDNQVIQDAIKSLESSIEKGFEGGIELLNNEELLDKLRNIIKKTSFQNSAVTLKLLYTCAENYIKTKNVDQCLYLLQCPSRHCELQKGLNNPTMGQQWYMLLGNCYHSKNMVPEAKQAYEMCCNYSKGPDGRFTNERAVFNIGSIYYKMGQQANAVNYVKEALAIASQKGIPFPQAEQFLQILTNPQAQQQYQQQMQMQQQQQMQQQNQPQPQPQGQPQPQPIPPVQKAPQPPIQPKQ